MNEHHTPHQTLSFNYRVFDIEIQKTIEQTPGGWEGARKGLSGFACGCIYDSESNQTWLFGPQEQEQFAEALEAPVVAVSFNGITFDVPALEGGLGRKLEIRQHLDLLDLMVSTVGSRKGLSLENLCQKTLGRGKTGDGALAPVMYQEALKGAESGVQTMTRLLNYCAMDVILTRDLLSFLQRNEFVIGPQGPIRPTLPPYFGQLVKVS